MDFGFEQSRAMTERGKLIISFSLFVSSSFQRVSDGGVIPLSYSYVVYVACNLLTLKYDSRKRSNRERRFRGDNESFDLH